MPTSTTADEFSRTVGNIYAQSWLKQEPIHVDQDCRPEVRKFIKKMSSTLTTAKITFSEVKKEPQESVKTEPPENGSYTEDVRVMSKTNKPLQSMLVVKSAAPEVPAVKKPKMEEAEPPAPPEVEIEDGEDLGDDNSAQAEQQNGGHVDSRGTSEGATAEEPSCKNRSTNAVEAGVDQSDGPNSSAVAPSNSSLPSSSSKSANEVHDDSEPTKKEESKSGHKHKKHKKEKKKHKSKSKSEAKAEKRKSSPGEATKHEKKKKESREKFPQKMAMPQNFDPLDPAPSRNAFPLPAGMDEGEIYSEHSDVDENPAEDLTSFVETSPEQFSSIVSSMNKFYSNAVVEGDEFVDGQSLLENNSDEEDLDIKDYDSLIIAGKVESEGDVCGLDVYVYNREEEELFVHHDYFLPAFPLAIEWLDYNSSTPNKKGNLVAVGTVKSEIEIWPVDAVGMIQPLYKLGAPKGLMTNTRVAETLSGHQAAVTCLSWNHIIRKGLASGSLDHTVAFWDLEKGDCLARIQNHAQPVSSVAFHSVEPYLLASGGFDNKACLIDLMNNAECICEWQMGAAVECLAWSSLSVNQLYVGQANGNIACVDLRFTDQVLYEFKAHTKAVTDITEDRFFPGCVVSVSEDSHLKLWNVTDYCPVNIKDKNMKMGHLSCVDSCFSNPFVYAVGGQSCGIRVVDFSNKAFSQFMDNTDGGES